MSLNKVYNLKLFILCREATNSWFALLALNYPSAMLTRSVNYLTKEMLEFVSFQLFPNDNYLVIIVLRTIFCKRISLKQQKEITEL